MKIIDKVILAACQIASKDDSRPVLSGIKFEKDRAVATDGFRLITVTYPDQDPNDMPQLGERVLNDEEVVLPAKNVEAALKRIPKNPNLPILNCAVIEKEKDGVVTITSTDLNSFSEEKVRKIDGTYPEYQKILDSTKAKEVTAKFSVNAQLMSETLKAMATALKYLGNATTVAVEVRGSNDPILITCESKERKIEALVMPVRSE